MEVVQGKYRTYTRKSLVGRVFGNLTVLEEHEPRPNVKRRWRCRCSCGNETISQQGHLVSGNATSCRACRNVRHGQARKGQETPEYRIWKGMLRRCSLPTSTTYKYYGARGIRVCERWQTFENFLADMGQRPSAKHSIERKDVNGDYEPENCEWLPLKRQARNTRKVRRVTAFGRTQCVAAWAEEVGLSAWTIYRRLDHGWPAELAITLPRDVLATNFDRIVARCTLAGESIGDLLRAAGVPEGGRGFR